MKIVMLRKFVGVFSHSLKFTATDFIYFLYLFIFYNIHFVHYEEILLYLR